MLNIEPAALRATIEATLLRLDPKPTAAARRTTADAIADDVEKAAGPLVTVESRTNTSTWATEHRWACNADGKRGQWRADAATAESLAEGHLTTAHPVQS
jgi:hypothetical protein